jgi:hypothetical protein
VSNVRGFYEGGMILFDPELAYQYECHLAAFLKHRREKYFVRGASHAWLYWLMLDEYDRKQALGQYKPTDYHIEPGDPLVALPYVPTMLWLKRRKLKVLEHQAFKVARRTPWISKHK